MARRQSTPATRASDAKKNVSRIRRKYKKDLTKPKKLMPGEEAFFGDMIVVLKLAAYTNGQIGGILGLSKGQVKNFLQTAEVQEKLVLLRDRLPQAALELLQGYQIEAVQTIADVMRSSEDDKMILAAAADILDRGGIPKLSRQERENVNVDNINITDDGIVDRLREASPEVQEKAAQLMESLEEILAEHSGQGASDESGS